MKKILIIEDDILLNRMICFNLKKDGYQIVSAQSVSEALKKLEFEKYDLILLDLNLPDGNGYEICSYVKRIHENTLIIFLTANDQECSKIKGYELGAIDYITKPFSITILQKKIDAMLVALKNNVVNNEIFDDGKLFIDFCTKKVTLDLKEVNLSALEFKMLKLFYKNKGIVLTRRLILEKLWDVSEKYVDEHTLTTTISRLRGKIEAEGDVYIKTIYGMGYQWVGDDK